MSWVHLARFISRLRNGSFIFRNSSTSSTSSEVSKISSVPKPSPQLDIKKDIIMFKYENPKFFRYLNIFAITQFGFWAFLSFSGLSMIDVPVKEVSEQENEKHDAFPFWRKINLGADKYKYGLAIGSFLMGYGILFVSWTYTLRSLRYLILRKDRRHVSFVTYTPFGRNRIMDVPSDYISTSGSRVGGAHQMPVKVKGKWGFYIVDLKEGQFPQPKLFDQTVGVQRRFS